MNDLKIKIHKSDISKLPCTMGCPECKQLGIRTVGWKNELHACNNDECDVKWYWKGGLYYV